MRSSADTVPLESSFHEFAAIALNAAPTPLTTSTINNLARITTNLVGTPITTQPSTTTHVRYARSGLVTHHHKEWRLTQSFASAWPSIASRSAVQRWDAIIRDLLPLRHHTGLLSFLATATEHDGGTQSATTHVHRLLDLLHQHVREAHYLNHTPDADRFLRRATTIAEQGRKHLAILQASEHYVHIIERAPNSAIIERLRLTLHILPPDATTWALLAWLTERTQEYCRAIANTGTRRTPCIDTTPVQIALNNLLSMTGTEPPDNPTIIEAHDTFASTVRAWLRALTSTTDYEYYAAHRASSDPRLAGKVHCACWDLEDSVKHLRNATQTGTEELLNECRTTLGAIPRNYAILFNGSLGHSYGDKDFSFHQHASQALHSTALSLAAIDDIRKSKRFPFPVYARAAIGTGKLTTLDGQPQSLSVNTAFHAINQAADHDRNKHRDESQLLIIEPIQREHPHLRPHTRERIDLGYAVACHLDCRRLASQFLKDLGRIAELPPVPLRAQRI